MSTISLHEHVVPDRRTVRVSDDLYWMTYDDKAVSSIRKNYFLRGVEIRRTTTIRKAESGEQHTVTRVTKGCECDTAEIINY